MTGNQVGVLLMNFILTHTDMSKYQHPAVIKTVVTSELGADIARKHGVTVFSTLTGFKFIGEKIIQFERAKLKGKVSKIMISYSVMKNRMVILWALMPVIRML